MNQMKLNNNASEKNAGGIGGVGGTGSIDGTSSMDSSGNEGGLDSAGAKKKGTDTQKNNAYNRKKTNKVKENPSATETEKDDGNGITFPSSFKSFSDRRRIVIIFFSVIMGLFVLFLSIDITAVSLYKAEDVKFVDAVCDSAVEKMKSAVNKSYDFSVLNSYADDYMDGFSQIQNIQFFLCNSRGKCIMCSENYKESTENISLTESQRENIKKSGKIDPVTLGIKQYSTTTLSKGKCFSVETKGIEEEYYILVVFPDRNFELFAFHLAGISAAFFLLVIAAIIVVMVVQYKNYVRYFTVYSEVVQRYARDDFSVKMPVPAHIKSDYFIQMIEATNELAVNIETSEERRKQFISNVSHELRTPMTSICGFVDGILDGTIPKNEHRKYLTIVSQETRRLKNMIQSMLNLTRIESGTLQLPKAEFNLTDVALRTLFLFENQISEKGVEVECNVDETFKINGNKDYIQQVIYNLVENAVKFVDESGTITLSINKSNESPDFVDISIRNTGEGLSSDEIPKIFDRFYKTDRSRSKDKTGLGLGLTICRRIVYLHGGTIMVKSKEGEYTEFTVHLPFSGLAAKVLDESKG